MSAVSSLLVRRSSRNLPTRLFPSTPRNTRPASVSRRGRGVTGKRPPGNRPAFPAFRPLVPAASLVWNRGECIPLGEPAGAVE
jgi:hypothetical protein